MPNEYLFWNFLNLALIFSGFKWFQGRTVVWFKFTGTLKRIDFFGILTFLIYARETREKCRTEIFS